MGPPRFGAAIYGSQVQNLSAITGVQCYAEGYFGIGIGTRSLLPMKTKVR